jgi:hypothetical protein
MYLDKELFRGIPYYFFTSYYLGKESELYSDDGLDFNQAVGPIPGYCYAGLGYLRKGSDAQALQGRLPYPVFLKSPHSFKKPEGEFRDYYIEVPVVLVGDTLTKYQYELHHSNGFDVINHMFWDNYDWEAYYNLTPGSFDPSTHGGNFTKSIDITSNKQNPGILYLLYPYYGPLPDEVHFTETYCEGGANLISYVHTDLNSSPQKFDLGRCFREAHIGYDSPPYETHLKLSVIQHKNSAVIIEGYKSLVYNHQNSSDSGIYNLSLRVSLTIPLGEDLSINLSVGPAPDTITGESLLLASSYLENAFGLKNSVSSITPTPGSLDVEFNPVNITLTIPAGQTSITHPIVMKRPTNYRYALSARLSLLTEQENIYILNNDILLTNTYHGPDRYDDSQLSVRIKIKILEDGNLVLSGYLEDNMVFMGSKNKLYNILFKFEHYHRDKAEFYLSGDQNLGLTARYDTKRHHKFKLSVIHEGDLDYTRLNDIGSRTLTGWLLSDGNFTNSSIEIQPDGSVDKIVVNFDLGYTPIIYNNMVNENTQLDFQLNLS